MRFLRYIRRWGKKVVFLLNKVDILASDSEVDEARPTPTPQILYLTIDWITGKQEMIQVMLTGAPPLCTGVKACWHHSSPPKNKETCVDGSGGVCDFTH